MLVTDNYKNRGWTVELNSSSTPPVKKKLEWNVFYYDFNRRKIDTYNIFDHGGFVKYVKEAINKYKDKESFAEQLKTELLYYFWSKAEYEVLLSPWIGDEKAAVKIDVYKQVMLNFDVFLDYVWEHKEKILDI